MRAYLDLHWLDKWVRNEKITSIPLQVNISVSWRDYEFRRPENNGYFPNGLKEGKHRFTIFMGIFYWTLSIVFFDPKTATFFKPEK